MTPQLMVRLTLALLRLTPLAPLVRVVSPVITTGADGLAMTIPNQLTALPSVLVQLAAVVTVEFQMALSPLPGATPLTQLPPSSKLMLLFPLIWSAPAGAVAIIASKSAISFMFTGATTRSESALAPLKNGVGITGLQQS